MSKELLYICLFLPMDRPMTWPAQRNAIAYFKSEVRAICKAINVVCCQLSPSFMTKRTRIVITDKDGLAPLVIDSRGAYQHGLRCLAPLPPM